MTDRCQSKILGALKLRPKGATKIQIAFLTGYRPKSGSFNQAIADLLSTEYVDDSLKRDKTTIYTLTALGKQATAKIVVNNPDVLEMWLSRLKTAERKILCCLVQRHPGQLDKEDIASLTNYSVTSGSFNQAIANLRKIELITNDDEMGLTEAFAGEMKR